MGIDPIAGLNSSLIILEDLKDYLCDYGIYTINQARNYGDGQNLQPYWLTMEDLDLGGSWKAQWIDFLKGWTHGGI